MPKKTPRIRGKRGDSILLFINARGFHYAAKVVDREESAKSALVWPMMALETFALELHIKALHRVRRRKAPRGHDVSKLFHELSKSDQKKIGSYLSSSLAKHPQHKQFQTDGVAFDVDSILLRARDMFTRARYWHELELPSQDAREHGTNAGVGLLSDAITRLILDLRPEWREKISNFRFRFPRTGLLPT